MTGDDPVPVELTRIIHGGDLAKLRRLVAGRPELASARMISTDDVDVAVALIDGGADLEVPGGSVGTPLDNAIGYGCWHVARLLVARGASVDALWHAAALGMLTRLDELLAVTPPPTEEDLNEAFWQACHGGQRRAAERLLAEGAHINATPGYSNKTALEATAEPDTRRELLAGWVRERGALSAEGG
jgi:hypothetical protein